MSFENATWLLAERYDGNRFFKHQTGRLVATPLFITLPAVESSDRISLGLIVFILPVSM